jgi:hypothetical protein
VLSYLSLRLLPQYIFLIFCDFVEILGFESVTTMWPKTRNELYLCPERGNQVLGRGPQQLMLCGSWWEVSICRGPQREITVVLEVEYVRIFEDIAYGMSQEAAGAFKNER